MLSREFYFAVPTDRWVGVHNLGFTPNVGLQRTDGAPIRGAVVQNDHVSTTVEYHQPVAGRMNLS